MIENLSVWVWLPAGLIGLFGVCAVWIFNTLVRLRNQVKAAWSDVDVQLARRHALVPSLVITVRAYAAHEQRLFEAVAALRAEALALKSPARLANVEEGLEHGVHRVLMLQEAYPDLKASSNFQKLQAQLVEIEDTLQYARRFYNGAVRDYNDGLQKFPNLLLARPFGFRAAEFFSVAPGAGLNPAVDLGAEAAPNVAAEDRR